jgi:hypothetical protein
MSEMEIFQQLPSYIVTTATRTYLAWFALVGYVPVCFGVGVLSMRLFSTFTPAFVVAIAWMIFSVITGNLALRFPCPRCGKWFFTKWWYYNGFARRCVHCGLPKYGDPLVGPSQ